MTQAIQSLLNPAAAAGHSASPRQGAAALFEAESSGLAFQEQLAEQSRHDEARNQRSEESVAASGREPSHADRAADDEPGARGDDGADAADRNRLDEQDGSRRLSKQDAAEQAERGEADAAESAEPAKTPADLQPVAATDAKPAEKHDAAQASVSVTAAAVSVDSQSSGNAGLANAQGPTGPRAIPRGQAASADPSAAQGLAGADTAATSLAETANAVRPVVADLAAQTTTDDESGPLVLRLATDGAGTEKPAKSLAHMSAPAGTSPTAGEPPTPATPAPAVNTASPSAGAQLTDTQQQRDTEQAALNNARLTRGLANAVQQRGGTVTLRLTPPEMGTVRIQMQMTGTTLAASLHTETASAHMMLTQQLGQLRTALESQGLSVERLHVQPMQQAQPAAANEQAGDSQQQPNDGRSRGQQDRAGQDARRDAQDPGRDERAGQPRGFADHLDATDDPTDD